MWFFTKAGNCLYMDSRDSEFFRKGVGDRLGGTRRGWRDHHLRFRLHLSFLRELFGG